jgi:manganese-dependent inorganic pyrophosphatase
MDQKEYSELGASYSVSQIETDSPKDLIERWEEIISALEKMYLTKDLLFAALLVTDVTALDSLLFVAGKKNFTALLNFPGIEGNIYVLKDVVSRKKQLVPLLSELVEKAMS